MKRLALLALALAWSTSALAQDCVGHPATEAERQYFRSVQSAARTLLPPAPAGWQVLGDREPRIRLLEPDALSCEDPSAGIANAFGRDYSRYSGEQWIALEIAHAQAREQRPDSPAAKQLRALRAEGEAQAAQLPAIMARQDFAALERLQQRIDELGQRSEAVQAQVEREDRVYDHFKPDSFIHLKISLNGGDSFEDSTCFGTPKRRTVKGAVSSIQCDRRDEERGSDDATIENSTVLIGFGQLEAASIDNGSEPNRVYINGRAQPTGPYTAIRTVIVKINGAPATLDSFIAGTDWSGFAQLVTR